jgi:DNA-binding LytR/AlgR family response regulator
MNLKKYRALVIEDENDIRRELIEELNETNEIEVVGEAYSIKTAYQIITSISSDIMFLDIRLLEGSSLDLLLQLKQNNVEFPPVVITTGFRDFEDAKRIHNELNHEVIAILNKPFWKQWEMNKIKIFSYLDKRNGNIHDNHYQEESAIILPEGRQLTSIFPNEIYSVKTGEKRHGKSIIQLLERELLCNLSLSQLMIKLPKYFMQVSRYECINTKQISFYVQQERSLTLKSGYAASVGEYYHSEIIDFMQK